MKNSKTTIKNLVNIHPVVKMPKEIRKRKNVILSTEIATTAILDLFSFSIKGAQIAITAGYNFIALILIICYFLKSVLKSAVDAFTDAQKQLYNLQSDEYITKNVSDISDTVRGKVFKKQNNVLKIVSNAEVIVILKDYINYIWTFFQQLPVAISNIFTTVIMLVSTFLIEFNESQSNSSTIIFMSALVICIIIFIILYKKRLKIYMLYKPELKELRKENEVLFNDIKNIEPLIKHEFSYRASLLVDVLKNTRSVEKDMIHKLNEVQIFKNIVLSLFMVLIIIIKLYSAGGIDMLDFSLVTEILAISSIYSAILDKISTILNSLEKIKNTQIDAQSLVADFDSVIKVFEKEKEFEIQSEHIDDIHIGNFEFSYPNPISAYKLENHLPLTLESGKSYLVYGHTGCGKSSFMHLLTGKIKLEESPISYGSNSTRAYLASIMHESNGRIGSNPILDELIFSKNILDFNQQKMIEILKGTRIYYDILKNIGLKSEDDYKVLQYLATTTIEQYSAGQKQRLAIVKVLYNLSSIHKIVVFDESTNALDDETAKSVLKFMADYCQRDTKRIVFFVTHQVEITSKITDGKITFIQKNFPSYEVFSQL